MRAGGQEEVNGGGKDDHTETRIIVLHRTYGVIAWREDASTRPVHSAFWEVSLVPLATSSLPSFGLPGRLDIDVCVLASNVWLGTSWSSM